MLFVSFLKWFIRSFYVRLVAAFLLIVILLFSSIVFSVVEINQISQSYETLNKLIVADEIATSAKGALLNENLQVDRLTRLNQAQQFADFNLNSNKAFDQQFQDYTAVQLGGAHDTDFVNRLQNSHKKHVAILNSIMEELNTGHPSVANNILDGEYAAQILGMIDILDRQDNWLKEQEQIQRLAAQEATGTIEKVLTKGGAVIMAIALLAAVLLTVVLGRSIFRLKQGVVALAEGNLSARVIKPGRDEIGQVGRAFNQMANRLGMLIEDVENKRKLGLDTSQEVNTIVSQLSIAANQQSSQATQQSSSLYNVTGTLQQLKEAASQIASGASQVAGSAQSTFLNINDLQTMTLETRQAGQFGQEQVKRSLESSLMVQNQVREYDQVLAVLTEHSQEIGKVNSVIKNIADETHLLSLNAAIEAAGAGQFGERFKVVSNEIKQLADASLKATLEVGQVVNTVRTAIDEVSQAMRQTSQMVGTSVEASEVAYRSISQLSHTLESMDNRFQEVVTLMQGVNGQVEQIKLMTYEQQSSVEEVTLTMRQLDTATRETASTSQQLAMTAIQLEGLAGTLTTKLAV